MLTPVLLVEERKLTKQRDSSWHHNPMFEKIEQGLWELLSAVLEVCKLIFFHWYVSFYCFSLLFLIGIHSIQDWTANARHGFTRKRGTKRLKHTGNPFRKNPQLKGVC